LNPLASLTVGSGLRHHCLVASGLHRRLFRFTPFHGICTK